MSKPIQAALPIEIELGGAWTIEWDAVDPTTGNSVSGVKISSANVVGTDLAGTTQPGGGGGGGGGNSGGSNAVVGPFMLVPGPDA